jgi:hypothetical protein
MGMTKAEAGKKVAALMAEVLVVSVDAAKELMWFVVDLNDQDGLSVCGIAQKLREAKYK